MSVLTADQMAAVVRVERETGLILAEAIACASQLPKAARDPALARLEERRASFQQSVDELYNLLREADPAAVPRSQPEAAAVSVVVNGLSGPRCTVEASTEWTVIKVQQAISALISVPVEWQTLIKDTERLPREATIASLLPDEAANSLQLSLLVQEVRPITFVGMQNGLEQLEPGRLRKTGSVGGWNAAAGAVSAESFEVDQGRGLRFQPGTTNKAFMIGLGSRSTAPTDYNDIECAALCHYNSQFYVFESGAQQLKCGPYSGNSTVELRIAEGQVEFLLDGVLQHTAQLPGQQRLYAMASFGSIGGEALDIQWL